MSSEKPLRLPDWLKVRLPQDEHFVQTRKLVRDLHLNTVCQEARCPNIFECFSKKVATFLILGPNCTRNCRFCNIYKGSPLPVDKDEPQRISQAVRKLKLKHVVITSVTRDDLADGGASHFAAVIRRLKEDFSAVTIEVLIPDFQGQKRALEVVLEAGPHILNHNVETVPRLYGEIRPEANYNQSLNILACSKEMAPDIMTKSGLMVGLGEQDDEVLDVITDLSRVKCDIVTIGQYMQPSRNHPRVKRYVHPDRFAAFTRFGEEIGIKYMYCSPLVRSSYNARLFVGKEVEV
ncbi:lipoyl synthase [Desulfohalobiaceae bacterium Ax17]|uniref:lipoyl synthase n=1 Tax=Desulfovulcanus ferrireducens TaxID=2831190 RepID=UPI00207BC3A6|nr:lipoyl synthase [Desulfovulcanus ferrireducens]MBT8763730.1 lipoyl synthase [Desulfovulcanus ferrireducens]